jgi:hypothetical protein
MPQPADVVEKVPLISAGEVERGLGSGLAIQHGTPSSLHKLQLKQDIVKLCRWRDPYESNWLVGCITSLHAATGVRTFTMAMQIATHG